MTPFLEFALVLAVIIASAKLAGHASRALGQPAVLGELLVGVLLGPSLIDLLHLPVFTHAEEVEVGVHFLAELGVLILMFVAGLEVDFEAFLKSGRVATLSGVMGVIAPMIAGLLLGLAYGRTMNESIFIGIVLAATSVSISAQTLMELGALRTVVGLGLLAAAVVDDVLVILILSVFLALVEDSGAGLAGTAIVVARMGVYLVAAVVIGRRVLTGVLRWAEASNISEGVLASGLFIMLLYSWSAEVLGGVAAITGAFIAGLLIGDSPMSERIDRGAHALAYSLLVPVFFVSVGLGSNVRALSAEDLPFTFWLVVAAIVAKAGGSAIGARLGGLDARRSTQVGIGMISRGEVGLIVATVGQGMGIIDGAEFTAVVIVVLVTTLVTPILLRVAVRRWPLAA